MVTVGVLGLQGDAREHVQALQNIGAETKIIRRASELDDVEALVIPGGESTTIFKLLNFSDLFAAIDQRIKEQNLAVMGTCAGMILSATKILGGRPDQGSFGIFDATVRRNGLGRQRFSFEVDLEVKSFSSPFPMVFIRGPVVEQTGPEVEVLAEWEGSPALCVQGPHLFATFHPELTSDGRIHRLFLERSK